jgi:uncharacterized protein YfdQ (DUF2303 family)
MNSEILSPILESESGQLLSAGAALAQPRKNPENDGRSYAVIPEGFRIADLPVLAVPKRPKGLVRLRDAASFTRYFVEHKVPRSRIYALLQPAKFLAVFDDFEGSTRGDKVDIDVDSQADWREFRAVFDVPASNEWTTWTGAHKKAMTQTEFAEFLLDNMPDVVNPSGSELYDAALSFEASTSGSFVATQRLQDGSHNLQWKADNNSAGTVKLPEFIGLSIPVFENESPVPLQARLRYRVTNGALKIWFELVRPHKVLEQAFRDVWSRIEAGAGVPILLGSPE